MDLNTIGNLSVMAGVKFVLASTSPFQELIDRPGVTHEFCNRQALVILRREGFSQCADLFQKYLKEINAGVYWADKGWKNTTHYFVPTSRTGLWRFRSALEEMEIYIHKAVSLTRTGDFRKAAFFLGAAVHLVQDACVPHHTRAKLFDGHKEYERWAKHNFRNYIVDTQNMEIKSKTLSDWLIGNAVISADMLEMVNQKATEGTYHKATKTLLPLAQRSTAGLFGQFFQTIIQSNYSLAKLQAFVVA